MEEVTAFSCIISNYYGRVREQFRFYTFTAFDSLAIDDGLGRAVVTIKPTERWRLLYDTKRRKKKMSAAYAAGG